MVRVRVRVRVSVRARVRFWARVLDRPRVRGPPTGKHLSPPTPMFPVSVMASCGSRFLLTSH